jgi:hypothetical protein
MNSIMERFFGSVRREAPDNFLLTGINQVQRSWMNMARSIMVSDRIRGFSNRFRSQVNRGR